MNDRITRLAVPSILFFTLVLARAVHGAYVKVDYPASTTPGELQIAVTYTLWIPDGVPRLRGIIVHQHGAGTTASIEGSTAAYDLHWQALARKWDCALLGPSYHVQNEKIDIFPGASELWFDPRRGSEKVFLRALKDLAAQSGHPEIETVPWALWGHSGGGIWADVMTTLHPDRVVAVFMRSGSALMFVSHHEFTRPDVPEALYHIPMICNPGVKEKPKPATNPAAADTRTPEDKMKGPWLGNLATFREYRAKGAFIAFAPDPRTGHECGDSRYLVIPFFDACLAMRLPDKGSTDQTLKPVDATNAWLAPLLGDEAVPAANYKGNANQAVWLPNEAVAKAWMEYVKTGAVGDLTPPPAPTAARVSTLSGSAAEITWSADADFESGIRQFLILRDGQELAAVPQTPVGKFGRPLFQSMTYHDTPAQPLPEMRFIDESARPGEHHAYAVVMVNGVGLKSQPTAAADAYVPFSDGEKSTWREGFDRFDYVMNESTLDITPFKAPEGEKFGVADPPKGQRRCIIIAPKKPAPGNPWSWRGCYWDHQPQTEVELLRRGFHIAYISANAALKPGKEWDAWYAFLTDKHGLSRKPAFIGMSRGGEYAYTWAGAHHDAVSCIYADNPGINRDAMMRLPDLARQDVPILHVCGSIDPLLGRVSTPIEAIYQQLGGRISVMIKDGAGHHPHSLRDPTPIADFIEHSFGESPPPTPAYAGARATRSWFYGVENSYREFPSEGTWITCRGPLFTECYSRYAFDLPGVEGQVTVIAPNKPAEGTPWVFRAAFVDRDAALVDRALLSAGFHIVTGPVPYNADGPHAEHWDAVYKHLTDHGFSRKPVMEGAGRAAGDAYAWAIRNPEKVSCIYVENPVLRSTMSKSPLIDDLPPLARAGVPLLHVCGSLDPALDENTRALAKRYEDLGGHVTVILKEGQAHYPTAPTDPKWAVEFIVRQAR